jgi:beta-glucosidase
MLQFIFFISIFTYIIFGDYPGGKVKDYKFRNPAMPLEERIDDLISHLTLEQKAGIMLYDSPGIDSLGIPAYNWWNECLHGVARAGKATVFPQAIGLAALFDDSLVFQIASAISDEARAKYNTAVKKNNRAQYAGLTFWTPNINIFRDPRWGRGQETYGEDPYLTARIGVAFVKGLQGNNPRYLKAAACAKHFAVHSGPENTRHEFNAMPDERDFRETYLPAFKSLVDAEVEAVMCAYNRLYDLPCCGSPYLLNDILRQEWGFKGHIVSDCWAPDDFYKTHKVVKTEVEAAAMAANAGVNLNCGYTYEVLPDAVKQGLVRESTIDSILRPLLRTRFKLGLFDPDSLNPFSAIDPSIVDCDRHRQLAYEAAAKSIVLLKNNGILPLRKDTLKKIYVTGPTATDVFALVGNYNGWSG